MIFKDRKDAGCILGQNLLGLEYDDHFLVLGLARGGVPIAVEVSELLGGDLDVFVVRKLGLPGHEELAMGAIGPSGVKVLNQSVVSQFGLDNDTVDRVAVREEVELNRRLKKYRQGKATYDLKNRDVLIVDDGLATGATMKAAISALRKMGPASIHVAVPVASSETCRELKQIADAIVCLETPDDFFGVGQYYHDFAQTTDEEVIKLMSASHNRQVKTDKLKIS